MLNGFLVYQGAGILVSGRASKLSIFSLRLAQPHTGTSAAVLIDEHDARGPSRARRKTVSARQTNSELLSLVERGEEVLITNGESRWRYCAAIARRC